MKKIHSFSLQWIGGIQIQIEVDVQKWLPGFTIVWLWDTSIQESRERIRSAIKNSGFSYPKDRITCNLAPAHIKKAGSHFDLPIALGILFENTEIQSDFLDANLTKTLIIGELALSGEVRKITGILPIVITALQEGWKNIIIPHENLGEVYELSWIRILPVQTISEAFNLFLKDIDTENMDLQDISFLSQNLENISPEFGNSGTLFESIHGQEHGKRCLMVAAAGWHNILLEWPPGSGKSMLADAISWILPPLSQKERLEVAQIYSSLWNLKNISTISRPFRKIHPNASYTSILGWWSLARAWEISLAHTGVLFFDEFLEFDKRLLESLREPLESKTITISRVHGKFTYPANFMLIWAMNPCPCWYLHDSEKECTDSKREIESYRAKLSGPILDRIDLHIRIPRGRPNKENFTGITTHEAREIIIYARELACQRQGKINSLLTPEETENLEIEPSAKELLYHAVESQWFSMRTYHRLLRTSRTLADMENSCLITENHIAEAMWFRI